MEMYVDSRMKKHATQPRSRGSDRPSSVGRAQPNLSVLAYCGPTRQVHILVLDEDATKGDIDENADDPHELHT